MWKVPLCDMHALGYQTLFSALRVIITIFLLGCSNIHMFLSKDVLHLTEKFFVFLKGHYEQ